MKRQLCATAFFALALIPDWAAACWPPGGGPGPAPIYYAPMYPAPVYSGPIYYPAQPAYVPIPHAAVAPRTEPARPIAQPNPAPAKPPQIEPVRPAAAVESPKPPATAPRIEVAPVAKPDPTPAPASEPKRGALFDLPKPAPEPKPPAVDVPKVAAPRVAAPEPKPPVLELPKPEETKLPPIDVPTGPGMGPKLPPLETSPAVPSAAPAPDALPIPSIPTPKKPDALPPLTLPPDAPVAPDKPVEAKSSPLTGAARELKVSVFPANGTAVANGLRKVGFFNHTARDLSLTIEGKAVTLPALSYINAELPSAFTWKYGDRPATKETVPAGSAGVDVLIREAK